MEGFDNHARNYKKILDDSIVLSGYNAEYFAEYKAKYLVGLAKNVSGKILDFGCGVGILSSFLKKIFPLAVVDGYDISKKSINMVHASLKAQGVYTSDINRLSSDYHLIVVSNVLHHISPGDRLNIFLELRERLSPGGKLVVFEHNPANPITRSVVDRCPFDKDAVLLPVKEALGYFKSAKFLLLRRNYIVFFPRSLEVLRFLEPYISWCPFGGQYVVVGEKYG